MNDTKRMTDERLRNLCEQDPGLEEDDANEVLQELDRARQSEATKSEALTMALHVLELYEEQASKVHVVLLNEDGVKILQSLIARVRTALQ